MAGKQWMRRLAKWHIWLGWLVGVPIVMWTVTGLIMVVKPIEEVRGNHLHKEVPEQALLSDTIIAVELPGLTGKPIRSVTTAMQGNRPITTFEYMDGAIERFGPDGSLLPLVGEVQARSIVADQIVGGDKVVSSAFFKANAVPFDFRREMDVWQVALADGTNVYVGQQTGEIAAVRTSWWRFFDFMWGLHIMDMQTREDTSHPVLILFAALGVIGSVLGCILMFRRRTARIRTLQNAG